MNKLKVNFFLKRDKTKNGLNAIYGKIKLGATSCTFSTAKYISEERWEKTNHLRNTLRMEAETSLKEYIYSIPLQIEKAYNQQIKAFENSNDTTATNLKDICFGIATPKKEVTLMEVVNKHNTYFKLQVIKGDRATGSLEKYERMVEVLKEYLMNRYQVNDIEFHKISKDFVFDLDSYLRFERVCGAKKGLGNNTTVKYIRNISVMFSHALKHGYVNENPFKNYDGTLEEVATIYLTEEELTSIENKIFSIRRLEVIKDIFLFSCYTSYAPCDAMKLTWDDLEKDGKGYTWIKRNRQKTNVAANVPVILKSPLEASNI